MLPRSPTGPNRHGRAGARAADVDPCGDGVDAETVQVDAGDTATAQGLVLGYAGSSHDDYMDGTFDDRAQVSVQGQLDDGTPTPSAMTWTPSALAPPTWVHFDRIHLCIRLEEASPESARFRLYRTQ